MCQICDVLASGAGEDAPPRFAAAAAEPDLRRASPVNLEAAHGAAAGAMPEDVGAQGRRALIKGGTILSMDERVGNHGVGDVLIDGSKIAEVAASIHAPDAAVIDAAGHIVMPGFVDAHSHQFETALRSFLADGILINDGRPESAHNYKAPTIIMNRSCRSFPWDTAPRTSTSTSSSPASRRLTPVSRR